MNQSNMICEKDLSLRPNRTQDQILFLLGQLEGHVTQFYLYNRATMALYEYVMTSFHL
jgi:hypothetical protein